MPSRSTQCHRAAARGTHSARAPPCRARQPADWLIAALSQLPVQLSRWTLWPAASALTFAGTALQKVMHATSKDNAIVSGYLRTILCVILGGFSSLYFVPVICPIELVQDLRQPSSVLVSRLPCFASPLGFESHSLVYLDCPGNCHPLCRNRFQLLSTTGRQSNLDLVSVEKETSLSIIDNPGQPFFQVLARHGAAPQDVPPMRPNFIKPERLAAGKSVWDRDNPVSTTNLLHLFTRHAPLDVGFVCKHQQACP